jgi:ubiquinone/menaquinone biosynthesis C-methylase UbiE
MTLRDWEKIYREKTYREFKPLQRIQKASAVFKEKGYQKILDLACGTGRHTIFLAKKGFAVYATDISPSGLKIATEKAMKLGLKNIYFTQHNMRDIPFSGGFFDAVICTWALQHGTLAQIQRTIGEVHRVLMPGGVFITDMPSITTGGYNIGREIEKHTFIGKKTEEDVPHHYTTKEEITELFSDFIQLSFRLGTRYYIDRETGEKHYSHRYYIQAEK